MYRFSIAIGEASTDRMDHRAPLVGGWKRGDAVVYSGPKFWGKSGTDVLEYGDRGFIFGPHNEDRLVCNGFPKFLPHIHLDFRSHLVSEEDFGAPLVGGWKRGDAVVYAGPHHRGESGTDVLEFGDRGFIFGPHGESQDRLVCNGFPNFLPHIHLDVHSHLVSEEDFGAPLVGGWKRGDPVMYTGPKHTSEDGTDVLNHGDVGSIFGPHGQSQKRLVCRGFPNFKQHIHLSTTHIKMHATTASPVTEVFPAIHTPFSASAGTLIVVRESERALARAHAEERERTRASERARARERERILVLLICSQY